MSCPRTMKDGPTKCLWTPSGEGVDGAANPHRRVERREVARQTSVYASILDHIGETPLVRLNKIPQSEGIKCDVLVKCEYFNAGGSVKDRIAKRMIEEAEASGRIKPGDTLIEPTSGNTGIGLALAAAVKGYRMVITLPEKMSQEKVDVLKALGAEIIRTPTEAAWDAPESHIGVARKLNREIPNSHILDQYGNHNNPLAHYDGTGEEIVAQTGGKVDMFVAGAGTGGTLTGTARKLKEKCPGIKIIGVDPVGSILAVPESLNGAVTSYQVEGIGYDFIPIACDRDPNLVDKWIKSEDKNSFIMARRLIKEEGLLCGGSSGTAVHYGLQAIKEDPEVNQPGKTCVIILPDSVRNYMTKFLSDNWMIERGFSEGASVKTNTKEREEEWGNGTIADLAIPKVVTVQEGTPISAAVETMNLGGFDNLPVVNAAGHMLGLLTIGNVLARIGAKRNPVSGADPVETVMFHFQTSKNFVVVTPETKLCDLQTFFDLHSVAFVTATANDRTPIGVISKSDVLRFLLGKKL